MEDTIVNTEHLAIT